MKPYFVIFGRTIGSYGVMAVLGLLASGWVAVRIGKRKGISMEDVLLLMISAAVGLLLGGHLLYGLTQWEALIALAHDGTSGAAWWKELVSCFSGMVFYGGLIGAYTAVCLHTRFVKGISGEQALDLLAITTPLFHAFGRVGCFLAGCCYGVESRWGFLITGNTLSPGVNGVVRLPVQLIEAGCNLIIFSIIFISYKREKNTGNLMEMYVLLYAPTRFLLEFFRGDTQRGIWWGLSTSQWISLLLVCVVLVRVLVHTVRRKRI